MSLKHGLLGLLNYTQMTGYDLSKIFSESLAFFWKAQTSQVYRELNSMEQDGWLTSTIEFQTDKPNKRLYKITDQGKKELNSWLKVDISQEMLSVKNPYLMKIFFSGNLDIESNLHFLYTLKEACERRLLNLESTNNNIEQYGEKVANEAHMLYWGMTAEFGKLHFSMCLNWAKDCIQKLEKLQ